MTPNPLIGAPSRVAGVSEWSPERMLTRLGGDSGLARELAAIFITECPRMLEALRASIEQQSADAVRRAAHAFKGSVLNFVDDGPASVAYELETIGRESRLAEAPAVFERLEGEVAALLEHLRQFQGGE